MTKMHNYILSVKMTAILMILFFNVSHAKTYGQDSLAIYLSNIDTSNTIDISIYEGHNYPYVSRHTNIKLAPHRIQKVYVKKSDIQINYTTVYVWNNDTVDVYLNATNNVMIDTKRDSTLFYYMYRNKYMQQLIDPLTWKQKNTITRDSFIRYTEDYFNSNNNFIKQFYGDRKSMLQKYLTRNNDYERLYYYCTEKINNKYIIDYYNIDSIVRLYNTLPSSVEMSVERFFIPFTSVLVNYIERKYYPDTKYGDDGYLEHYIGIMKRYFTPNLLNYSLLSTMNDIKNGKFKTNPAEALFLLQTIQASTITAQHKVESKRMYQDYLNSTKKLSDYADVELISMDGKIIKMKDILAVGKPVLFDFWATWCSPCVNELPAINKAEQKYTDIQFVRISIDQNLNTWRQFAVKHDMNKEASFVIKNRKDNLLFNSFSVEEVPRYLLFNKKGICVSASFTRPSEENFDNDIRKLTK